MEPKNPMRDHSDRSAKSASGLSARQMAMQSSQLQTSTQGEIMNKDQVKGTIKDAAGKVQEAAGKVIGSNEQQFKGVKKQVEGQAQKTVGDVKEVVKDIGKK